MDKVRTIFPKVAKKNIPIYVEVQNHRKDWLQTYREGKAIVSRTLESKINIKWLSISFWIDILERWHPCFNGVYCFNGSSKQYQDYMGSSINEHTSNNPTIPFAISGYIPKGTLYYESENSWDDGNPVTFKASKVILTPPENLKKKFPGLIYE